MREIGLVAHGLARLEQTSCARGIAQKDERERWREGEEVVVAFEFEKLIVFERALDAAAAVDGLVQGMPYARRRMKDQVGRAVDSLVLNIAEGSGEFTRREKARFYRIARRSACETAAGLRLAVRYRLFPASRIEHALALLDETAAMLTAMCNNLTAQARAAQKATGEGVTARASACPRPAR